MSTMTAAEYHAKCDSEMTEEEHQIRLFNELGILAVNNPVFDDIFHIPNGGHRHKATAGKMKAAGVKSGIPDIFVAVARYGFHGAFIELKSLKLARLSHSQKMWIAKLNSNGYRVYVCYGWREALKAIKEYLAE